MEMKDMNATCAYHKLSLDELDREFQTSCTRGLTEEQARTVLARDGPNVLKPADTHFIRKVVGYMFGGFCWLLWIGVITCFLAWRPIGDPKPDPTNLGLAILFLIVIMLQAAFEAFQDWSSSKVMKSIKGMMAADSTVIRNGVEQKVPAANIVVGDLVLLTYGNKVPADLRLIESMDLKFDRAMLTGESEAVEGMYTYRMHLFVCLFVCSIYSIYHSIYHSIILLICSIRFCGVYTYIAAKVYSK